MLTFVPTTDTLQTGEGESEMVEWQKTIKEWAPCEQFETAKNRDSSINFDETKDVSQHYALGTFVQTREVRSVRGSAVKW